MPKAETTSSQTKGTTTSYHYHNTFPNGISGLSSPRNKRRRLPIHLSSNGLLDPLRPTICNKREICKDSSRKTAMTLSCGSGFLGQFTTTREVNSRINCFKNKPINLLEPTTREQLHITSKETDKLKGLMERCCRCLELCLKNRNPGGVITSTK